MIQLLFGDNAFEIEQLVRKMVDSFSGEAEKVDGSSLELNQLPGLLMGATLFAERRLIIISGLSAQKELWGQLTTWLERLSDDTQLILIEPSVDKRTKTYKWLQKNAQSKECVQLRDYESSKAINWLTDYAAAHSTVLSQSIAALMVQRAVILSDQGKAVIDQQLLARAIDGLAYAPEPISESMLDAVLPPSAYENVFELLATAMRGDMAAVMDATKRLALSEDGHRVAALICSQAVNLSVLSSAHKAGVSSGQVAKDIGVHPFALSQLDAVAGKLSYQEANNIVERIVMMDNDMKTGQLDAWTAITTTLVKIAFDQ